MNLRLKLVLLMMFFILMGCQIDQENSHDLTTRQSLEISEYALNEMFVSEDVTLVGLGDSLTQGVGDERKMSGYLGRLATKINTFQGVREVKLYNEAKRGKRSDQLLKQLLSNELDESIQKADIIVMTIGGNDIMRIVKKDLFHLRVDVFDQELLEYTKRYGQILAEIRSINPTAPIILMGLYNPFSIVTDEVNEFDEIITSWNKAIFNFAYSDINACFVPVDDLFNSNANMVYHTDFFHPNSKGYEQMTDRIIESIEACGLNKLTNGEMDF